MLKKLVSILFEEEEITIEEDLNEVPVSQPIPKIEPIKDKSEFKEIKIETKQEDIKIEEVPTERKSMMIDVDSHVQVQEPETTNVLLPKKEGKYQPKDIISPIFGGPSSPSDPIEPTRSIQSKTRQPLTEIISPMFGKVETPESSKSIDSAILDIELSEMLSPIETGEEVQASLFDYLEGFNDDEE